tara:strand:+ start:1570 stop:2211 length:642 start_codon:yes stop_codon:yes gene_type:complete
MALRNAVGGAYAAASVKNDGGTVVKGGGVASDSPMTNSLGLNTLADDFGVSFGSKVVAQADTGDKAGVQKAVSGGTLAYQAGATEWVIKGGNVASTIGGVSNDALVSPARDTGDLNDFATEAARTKISDRLIGSKADEAFDIFARPSSAIVPGRTKGSNAGNASTMVNPADGTAAVATEIAPSQAVPGELTYFFGELAAATTDEYKAKNAAES